MGSKLERKPIRRANFASKKHTPDTSSLCRRHLIIGAAAAFFGVTALGVINSVGKSPRSPKLRAFPSLAELQKLGDALQPEMRHLLEKFNSMAVELASLDAVEDIRIAHIDVTSRRLIVHILQEHDQHGGQQGRPNKRIRVMQEGIYHILKCMMHNRNLPVKEVYLEGLLVSQQDDWDQRISKAKEGNMPFLQDELEANAALRLAVEDGLILRAMEDPQTVHANERIVRLEEERPLTREEAAEFEKLSDDREDFVLGLIAQRRQALHVMTLGSYHDLRNNIQRQNAVHPQNGFGLIEIKPFAPV